jgi:TfoX/Sxy family transcriptional regulator of competence genes
MAYDQETAQRIRDLLNRRKGITERKMFGGLAFLVNGHMACGLNGERLMLRLGNEEAAQARTEPHTSPMDFTGKPLKSMVYVEPAGFRADDDLRAWVNRASKFAKSLPPKT